MRLAMEEGKEFVTVHDYVSSILVRNEYSKPEVELGARSTNDKVRYGHSSSLLRFVTKVARLIVYKELCSSSFCLCILCNGPKEVGGPGNYEIIGTELEITPICRGVKHLRQSLLPYLPWFVLLALQ